MGHSAFVNDLNEFIIGWNHLHSFLPAAVFARPRSARAPTVLVSEGIHELLRPPPARWRRPPYVQRTCSLDHRLFRQDRFQHPQIVPAEDEADLLFPVTMLLQALDHIGQIFDFFEAFDQRVLVQRVMTVF